jgi:feruloyl esterase
MIDFGLCCRWDVVSVVLLLLCSSGSAFAVKPAVSCGSLVNVRLADTVISSATVVPAGTFTPAADLVISNVPEFCRVVGVTKPSVRFEVWLPQKSWNGKFEGVGNGGTAGFIAYRAMATALKRGYTAASTDTGHINVPPGNGFDASWARGRVDLVADFGYRGLHVTTVNGKQLVDAFYGKAPQYSYYVGCSKGGGQGLMEAQRYPDDYDGILAGDPANNWTGLYAGSHLWYSIAMLKEPGSYIPPEKVAILANAVNKACDANDGIEDGVIDDPLSCRFDPATLTCKEGEDPAGCFSAKQVKAIKDIWSGVHTSSGKLIFPGLLPGGEAGSGGWTSWVTGSAPFAATHWKAASGFFRDAVFNDPKYNPLNFNYDKDMETLTKKFGPMLDAVDPDLRPLQRSGGKMILYHGLSDPDISALNSIHYYEQVQSTVGKSTPDFVRLFLVPGMQHCGSGPGATAFDGVAALEKWVEDGVAPTRIIASHVAEGMVERTRPLCPYPQAAVYVGKGSTSDAANFVCKAPPQGSAQASR